MDQNYLCNLGGGHQEEQLCEIILNLKQWFRRCRLKDLLSYALTGSAEQNYLCNFGTGYYDE